MGFVVPLLNSSMMTMIVEKDHSVIAGLYFQRFSLVWLHIHMYCGAQHSLALCSL